MPTLEAPDDTRVFKDECPQHHLQERYSPLYMYAGDVTRLTAHALGHILE